MNQKTSYFGIQRKIVAEMTSQSWQNIPHVSYQYEPDITKFLEAFSAFKEKNALQDSHISLNTVIVKILCEALKSAPKLNAHIDFNARLVRGTVTTFPNIDVSMPWALPNGKMMTITMKDMGSRSLSEIGTYIDETAAKIKNTDMNEVMYSVSMKNTFQALSKGHVLQVVNRLIGSKLNKNHRIAPLRGKKKQAYDAIPKEEKLTYKDLEQGTITISNIGAMTKGSSGRLAMLMIIPPQVCAIGIGAIQKEPVVVTGAGGKDEIAISTFLPLCICFDHRVLDFGDVKPFLTAVQDLFDHPETILYA